MPVLIVTLRKIVELTFNVLSLLFCHAKVHDLFVLVLDILPQ